MSFDKLRMTDNKPEMRNYKAAKSFDKRRMIKNKAEMNNNKEEMIICKAGAFFNRLKMANGRAGIKNSCMDLFINMTNTNTNIISINTNNIGTINSRCRMNNYKEEKEGLKPLGII